MKDILKKQKIKKRLLPRKFLTFLVLALVLSAALWLGWRGSGVEGELPLWAVEVKTMDASPLPPRVEEFVITSARQNLLAGGRQQLQEVATVIGADPQLAAVQVIKTARDRVVVYVDVRRPALVVQVNSKLRYIGRRGDIYGRARAAEVYPVLEGVLDPARQYARDEDGLYVLSDAEQTHVQQALELARMALQNGFICEKIIYEQYRGWQAKIEDVAAVVFFGPAPFAAKLQKLRDILASLRAKNTQAARIELDYEDKAFVQQKKI